MFSLIMLDSFVRVNKKYYPQKLLEEPKYEITKIKWRILLMAMEVLIYQMNLII